MRKTVNMESCGKSRCRFERFNNNSIIQIEQLFKYNDFYVCHESITQKITKFDVIL